MDDRFSFCIAGWTFKKDIYESVKGYNAYAVSHAEGDTLSVPQTLTENIGLDWHQFDYYLKQHWNKKSDVFFFQDDLNIYQKLHWAAIYDTLKLMDTHHCWFHFPNTNYLIEEIMPRGRGFFCSIEFLNELLIPRKTMIPIMNDLTITGFLWDAMMDLKYFKTARDMFDYQSQVITDYPISDFMRFVKKTKLRKTDGHFTIVGVDSSVHMH